MLLRCTVQPGSLQSRQSLPTNSTLGDLVVLQLPLQPIDLDFRAPSVRLDEHAEVAGVLLVRNEDRDMIDALEIIHAVGLSDIVWPAEYIQNGRVQLGKIGLGQAAEPGVVCAGWNDAAVLQRRLSSLEGPAPL